MTNIPDVMPAAPSAPAPVARALLRAARVATLATTMSEQPYAALVTPACLPDLSLLLLLSELSQHTIQLRANPRCGLLCTGAPPAAAGLINPQTTPRLSLLCHAAPDADPGARDRYLAIHPYAGLYAQFGDFQIWRLTIERAQLVQGFAQACWVTAGELVPPGALVAALAQSAAGVIEHCNRDHADAMRLLGATFGGGDDDWRLVGIDPDGCDLMAPGGAARVAWPMKLDSADDVRGALMELLRRARGR